MIISEEKSKVNYVEPQTKVILISPSQPLLSISDPEEMGNGGFLNE